MSGREDGKIILYNLPWTLIRHTKIFLAESIFSNFLFPILNLTIIRIPQKNVCSTRVLWLLPATHLKLIFITHCMKSKMSCLCQHVGNFLMISFRISYLSYHAGNVSEHFLYNFLLVSHCSKLFNIYKQCRQNRY